MTNFDFDSFEVKVVIETFGMLEVLKQSSNSFCRKPMAIIFLNVFVISFALVRILKFLKLVN